MASVGLFWDHVLFFERERLPCPLTLRSHVASHAVGTGRGRGGEGCARRRRWMPLLSQPAKVRGSAETGSAASRRLVWAALLGPWCDLFGLRD